MNKKREFFRAENKDFDRIYEIMDSSFPDNEMRTKEKFYNMFTQNEHYNVFCIGNKQNKQNNANDVIGFIVVWDLKDFIFLENFAIDKSVRGQGLGGDLLNYIIDLYKKDVILEVELPESDITRRRIKFYERHNFIYNDFDYLMPPLKEGDDFLPLKIMSYKKSFTKNSFENYKELIYNIAYKI